LSRRTTSHRFIEVRNFCLRKRHNPIEKLGITDIGQELDKMMKRRSNSVTGSMGRRGSTTHADPSADAALAKMGYQSELPRNLSMMSVLGL
jgi:hypothetical protein